ncbi:hypothetical protein BDZ89DRAFT_1055472 [Hymenopellis radicata]|nr:hypothetical protein BDZ89DRAFT_1055472 [Hymenopellis radicata]
MHSIANSGGDDSPTPATGTGSRGRGREEEEEVVHDMEQDVLGDDLRRDAAVTPPTSNGRKRARKTIKKTGKILGLLLIGLGGQFCFQTTISFNTAIPSVLVVTSYFSHSQPTYKAASKFRL